MISGSALLVAVVCGLIIFGGKAAVHGVAAVVHKVHHVKPKLTATAPASDPDSSHPPRA